MAGTKSSRKIGKSEENRENRVKNTTLSKEHVDDSGSDSGSEPAEGERIIGSTDNKEAAVASSGSEEESSSSNDSSEDESDEEDTTGNSDSSGHQDTSKVSAPMANGMKRKASSDTSDIASSIGTNKEQSQDLKNAKRRRRSPSSSRSFEKEDDVRGNAQKDTSSPKTSDHNRKVNYSVGHTSNASKQFQPPTGFSPFQANGEPVRTAISNTDVGNSHVWHIMAPSNVSLSLLRNVTLESILSGQPLLTNEGTDYTLIEDKGSEAMSFVALPGENGYELISKPVSRTLNLQQIIRLPTLDRQKDGSSIAADVHEAPINFTRAQPKGLRMRFLPPGSGTRSTSTESETDTDDRLSFRKGKQRGLERSESRKTMDNSSQSNQSEQKKRKKGRSRT